MIQLAAQVMRQPPRAQSVNHGNKRLKRSPRPTTTEIFVSRPNFFG